MAKNARPGKNKTTGRPNGGLRFTRKRARKWGHRQLIIFLVSVAVLLNLFVGGVLYLFVMLDIPDIRSVAGYHPKMTSRILDSQGAVIAQFGEENRTVIPLAEMPALLPLAFVAAEDARFYGHPGVDLWSVLRALVHNIRAGARAQGGSTITQQVARSLLLSRRKLYTRKIKEAILAYRIDSRLTKNDILHIYLNQIYLGEGAYGVEAAARTYFNKPARDLELAEIAVLAGLPQAPSRYSPFKNLDLARKRQIYVLNRMAEDGYISGARARQAFEQPLALRGEKEQAPAVEAGYFVQYVANYLVRQYGQAALHGGGLTILTTLDSRLQDLAVKALKKGVPPGSAVRSKDGGPPVAPQGGLVALDVKTGEVKALVGGLDFTASPFDRATQARRQPGSAIKPLIYAAALEAGFSAETLIDDQPLSLPGARPGERWEPQNFDRKFRGPTTLREGLVWSSNVVAIKLLQRVGVARVVRLARKMGIKSPLTANLSLALGSSEVSLLELTSAYAVFANQGRYAEPIFIRRLKDRYGKIIEENPPHSFRAMSPQTAAQMTDLLTAVVREGTGRLAGGLPVPAAGKTGTTDRNMDAWFVGYASGLAAGVWVGNDRKEPLDWGMTGGRVAAPIWHDFMRRGLAP